MRIAIVGGTIDLDERVVTRAGTITSGLSAQEAALLRRLAERGGAAVPRQELLGDVMGYRAGSPSRALDHAIGRIRGKIEADADHPVQLLTVRGVGYRLVPPSALVGREELLEAVEAALGPGRVATLHGPGGVGKTALATVLAARVAAPVARLVGVPGDRLAAAIAVAVGAPGPDPEARIADAIARGAVRTLILDEAEHVAPELAALLPRWLAAGVGALVTSRRPLDLPEEVVFDVPGLSPAAARALYAARGGSASGDVEPLMARLDGLPLAIEFAAAWSAWWGPAELASRLADGPEVLASPDGSRTLVTALDTSWTALSEGDREALSQAAAFVGPFTLPDAEAVWAVAAAVAQQRVRTLCAWALLGPVGDVGATPAFRMLEPIRSWVRHRAPVPPDAVLRHARRAEAAMSAANGDAVAIEAMRPDVEAAIRATLPLDPALSARLVLLRFAADYAHLPPTVVLADLDRALAAVGGDHPAERARLHAGRGQIFSRIRGASEAVAELELAVAAAETAAPPVRALVHRLLGVNLLWAGQPAASRRRIEEARGFAALAGDLRREADALEVLAHLDQEEERPDRAVGHLLRVVAIANGTPGVRLADALRTLATSSMALGDLDGAEGRLDQAFRLDGEGTYGSVLTTQLRCTLRFLAGDLRAVRALADELRSGPRRDRLSGLAADTWPVYCDWAERGPEAAEVGLLHAAAVVARDAGWQEVHDRYLATARAVTADRGGPPPEPVAGLPPRQRAVWAAFGAAPAARAGDPRALDLVRERIAADAAASIGARVGAVLLGLRSGLRHN